MNTNTSRVVALSVLVTGVLVGITLIGGYRAPGKRVYGTSCTSGTVSISQQEAEGVALSRAALVGFEENGGAPTITYVAVNSISAVTSLFDVFFDNQLSDTTCVWYVVMSGIVNAKNVASLPGPTSTPGGDQDHYNVMEVGIDASTAELLTETFIPTINGATPTFVPTPTGTQATPYPVPTLLLTPFVTPTP